MRRLSRLFQRRCWHCKGKGHVRCWLCDAPDYDCLLCVKGVAACFCALGVDYLAVTVETTAGPVRMARKDAVLAGLPAITEARKD